TLAEKEKAITNYADVLGIDADTFGTKLTMRAIADELTGSISTVLSSYADGMDDDVEAIVKKLEEEKSKGGSATVLGGGSGSSSGIKAQFSGGAVPSMPTQGKDVISTTEQEFTDIANYAWAKDSIELLSKRNILAGYENGTFNPEGLLTREQAVKLLILTLNIPTDENKNGFKDCEYGSWYYPYITSAKSSNLISGISGIEFGIGQHVTRQDLAVMIYRALNREEIEISGETRSFADDDMIFGYAKDAVSALSAMGLITGYDNGSFGPAGNATRAEAAVIFARLLQTIEKANEEVPVQ
ncbi:MAG: S-layer homology domain-containing protein, partial [Clostridia bacterium]